MSQSQLSKVHTGKCYETVMDAELELDRNNNWQSEDDLEQCRYEE